ncbi:hypothetical protein L207DRAFT_520459 [Hyaloscypha variabilis F]|uniref:C2H2-type domain-containing protein n=1 Tax=Hyaloscypha variabilis (strain UAMH 11265 / GT02V1 / F) TaxID=1149755 RepID=A0A2J6QUZ2_HYAVF|nr:hypothetical protein L207DRAFT_520459 [Hyaloscypha variabilis F]
MGKLVPTTNEEVQFGVGNFYRSGSCCLNSSSVSILPSSGGLAKTASASQNLPFSSNTRFYHVQSDQSFSANHQSPWLPRDTWGQDLAVYTIASPIDAPLPFNDDLIWDSDDQLGFMIAPAANNMFDSAGDMTSPIRGLSGSYLDPLGPLQQDVDFDGSMLEPLQDFDDFAPVFDQPAQDMPWPALVAPIQQQSATDTIFCTQSPCPITFKRDTDRIRHEAAVHGINKATYLYHVVGCDKSHGVGYTRKDKLTEHLWKKHADLGFVKRA